MPSLVGFSPPDAKRPLALADVTGVLHRRRGGSGLPRVVAQDHPAGATLPVAAIVNATVARPARHKL